jgi:hypothetical protein
MTKISNQYSLTNILTADLANSRLGINNVSPAYSLDLTGTARVSTSAYLATASGSVGIGTTSVTADYDKSLLLYGVNPSFIIQTNDNTGYAYIHIKTPSYDWSLGYDAANNFKISNGANPATATKFTLTSAGNVGIGTSSPTGMLHVIKDGAGNTNTSITGSMLVLSRTTGVGENIAFRNTGTSAGISGTTYAGQMISAGNNIFELYTDTTNPIIFGTNATERMRINSGGSIQLGSTTNYVNVGNDTGGVYMETVGSEDGRRIIRIQTGNSSFSNYSSVSIDGANQLVKISTSNTERMRITSGGWTKISNDGTYNSSTGAYHEIRSNISGNYSLQIANTNASPFGLMVYYPNTLNNTTNRFLDCEDNTTLRFSVRSNGGLANYQANNVNLSDIRTKKDIIPLESYWNKFKAIEIVKFKYKDQTHDDYNIGVISQQVESVAPEFVDADGWGDTPEDGIPLKSIYTSDLHHATIKVLQEAMIKIEELSAENTSLINRIEALENK